MADTTVKPRAAVRRFDIFAKYNRRKAAIEGQPAVRQAIERGEPFEAMRDALSAGWKPAAK